MATPNNPIRPAILNINNSNGQNNNGQNNTNNSNEINSVNMEQTIARICAHQCQLAIAQFLRPSTEISGEDETIDERYRGNLTDLDKVPDVVRSLREFSGQASEFSSWKKSVERILKLYESTKGTPKYFAILNTIRNKIIGNADAALESYNTPLNWNSISRCLTLHYADKRDLTTLEYQMTTLVQGNNNIQDFYQEVYSHLTLIMNKLSCLDVGKEALDILAQTYRDKALDVFIRGLKGQMSIHLGMKEPTDLPQALQLCLKMENQFARAQFANSHNPIVKNNKQTLPKAQYQNKNQLPFYPQLTYLPQHSGIQQTYSNPIRNNYNQPYYPQFHQNKNLPPPRPSAPKPQPKPEPMEIDTSMQSRAVNYMNRPAQNNRFHGKRPTEHSDQFRRPDKAQRNFHVDTGELVPTAEVYETMLGRYENQEQLPPLDDYIQNQYDVLDNDDGQDTQEFVDIHFLD